jgi:hypothetical protein
LRAKSPTSDLPTQAKPLLTAERAASSTYRTRQAGTLLLDVTLQSKNDLARSVPTKKSVKADTVHVGVDARVASVIALPSVLMVVSFYILAVHMHVALGGWPKQIGESGFPRALVIHAALTTDYFGIVLLTTILLCPPTIVVCWLVRRWRPAVPYLLAHYGFFIAGMIVMHLAPAQFIDWWWD